MSDTHAQTVLYVRETMLPQKAPPALESGAIRWMRQNLFSGLVNSILTVLGVLAVFLLVKAGLPWLLHSVWNANSLPECRQIIAETWGPDATGACWAMIRERWTQFVYGFYPSDLYWRPALALVLLLVALVPVLFTSAPRKLLWLSMLYPFVGVWLMWGGSIWGPISVLLGLALVAVVIRAVASGSGLIFGVFAGVIAFAFIFFDPISTLLNILGGIASMFSDGTVRLGRGTLIRQIFPLQEHFQSLMHSILPLRIAEVRSSDFGGFVLSVTIGVAAISMSLPLGILLALGRKSDMPLIKMMSVGFIEFIRGVPLITLLFVASLLLNYFLPPGSNFDIILRVIIMVTLFAAAYIAEVIRGGLAALPRGQFEAADALGLNYWQAQQLIILPQALKISIPGIVSTFIGLFKDTTLVVFVGLLDPLKGITDAVRSDINWKGIYWEPYIFVAAIFFIFNFSMSRYSMYLENKLKNEHR